MEILVTNNYLKKKNHKIIVSIIIPVFNKIEFTKKCLQSIFDNTDSIASAEIIVVNNGSTDGTKEFLAEAETLYPNIEGINPGENLGFARANNLAAKSAKGDYLLFLNNDTEVQKGWLDSLIKVLQENPQAAVAGSKLLYPDNTIQHAGVVIVKDEPMKLELNPYHLHYREKDTDSAQPPEKMYAVTAACMLIRKDVFNSIGGFDEEYRNGYEDVDLCFKVLTAGHDCQK